MGNILLTVLGIGLLIFIHEAGHYLAARAAGVRVLVFSLGFGPRLWGFRRGNTDYRVSLVPVGGYVIPLGMDNYDRTYLEHDELHAKGFWARLLFFSGGVMMNLLFALLVFPLVFHNGVEFTAPVVGAVTPGSTAWHAGIEPGDRILRIDDKEIYAFENLRVEIALAGARPVRLEVERRGVVHEIEVTSRYDAIEGLRRIGVEPAVDRAPARLEVHPGSPAAAAGLDDGDLLIAVDGEPVATSDLPEVLDRLSHGEPDRPVTLTVRGRGGAERDVTFRPVPVAGVPRIGVRPARQRVVAVRELPLLERLGLHAGDDIVAVDGQPFFGDDQSIELLRTGPARLSLTVSRGADGRLVELGAPATAAERALLPGHVALGFDTASGGNVVLPTAADSPAARAGLQRGDRIVRIAGRPTPSWDELAAAVRASDGGELPCVVVRAGSELALTIQPARTLDPGFTANLPYQRELYQVEGVAASLHAGAICSLDLIKQLYVTLKEIITGDVSARNLGGIIQISRVSYAYAESGWARFFYFLALLSLNLAFVNILPIPVLDGGHLLFLLIEKVKGSPVNARVHSYSLTIGLVFVVGLMVFVTYNDILRWLS